MQVRIASRMPALMGLTALLLAPLALAQTSSNAPGAQRTPLTPAQTLLDDRFVINAGVFLLSTSTDANLNGSSIVNPQINFGQQFGTNADTTRVRADVLWRATPTQHLRFMYFDDDVTKTRTLTNDAPWGDYIFQKGAAVSAQTKFTVYEMAYEYAFLREENYEVAASAGIHYMDFSARLAGSATVANSGGQSATASFQSKTASEPAPLPVIGLRAGWAFAPQLYVDAQGQLFKVRVDGVDGSWSDLRLGVTWMFSHAIGIGAGYDRFATHVGLSRTNFAGNLDATYSGLQAYLTGGF